MRIRRVVWIAIALLCGCVASVGAITWEETDVVDPVSGQTITVHTWGSYGSYVYQFPSKYDGVYFPHTDSHWIWFSPHSGYTAFGDAWNTLTEDQVDLVRDYLASNYDPSEGEPTLARKLELLAGIQRLRDVHWTSQAWFYRVLAAYYGGNASDQSAADTDLALQYRARALPIVERWARYIVPGFDKIQHYFLAGDYYRQLGDHLAARLYFARARQVSWIDENGNPAVGHSYITPMIDERERLLEPAPADTPGAVDQRMIFVAGTGGNVARLTGARPDLAARTSNGRTALMWASWAGHATAVRVLLAAGADVNDRANELSTPLLLSASEAHTEIVDALLTAGADVNTQDDQGMTALMFAALRNEPTMATALIEAGADIYLKSGEGGNAMDYASVWGDQSEVLSLLYAREGEVQRESGSEDQDLYDAITGTLEYDAGPYAAELPEGMSVYYGEYTCGQGLAGSVTVMHRRGGDLTVVSLNGNPVSETNLQPISHLRAVGTYNPESNRFTQVPDGWIAQAAPGWIMAGRTGTYDPRNGGLAGRVSISAVDYAGTPICSTFSHRRVTATSDTDLVGDVAFVPPTTLTGSVGTLARGVTRWVGRHSCDDGAYDVTIELRHRTGGELTGTVTLALSDRPDRSAGYFIVGTHNPVTGRFSVGPQGWVDSGRGDQDFSLYFVDGHRLTSPDRLCVRFITGSGPCDGTVFLSPEGD